MRTKKLMKVLIVLLLFVIAVTCVACNNDNKIESITVTFESNGGSEVPPITISEGDKITLPTAPTKDGYTFDGWCVDEACVTEFIETQVIPSNITLYAKWTLISKYAISFAGGEDATGEAPTVENQYADATISLPTNTFEKANYTFAGWNDGTTTYNAGATFTVPASAVNFTAQWTENGKYTISFAGGEGATGEAPTVENQYAGAKITLPYNEFKKTLQSFEGWSDGTNTYLEGAEYIVGTANINFTAQWKLLPLETVFKMLEEKNFKLIKKSVKMPSVKKLMAQSDEQYLETIVDGAFVKNSSVDKSYADWAFMGESEHYLNYTINNENICSIIDDFYVDYDFNDESVLIKLVSDLLYDTDVSMIKLLALQEYPQLYYILTHYDILVENQEGVYTVDMDSEKFPSTLELVSSQYLTINEYGKLVESNLSLLNATQLTSLLNSLTITVDTETVQVVFSYLEGLELRSIEYTIGSIGTAQIENKFTVEEICALDYKYAILDGADYEYDNYAHWDFDTETYTPGWVLNSYNGGKKRVTIAQKILGEPVLAIRNNAFRDNGDLVSVVIPSGVKEIWSDAFFQCSNLSSVTIGDGLTYIGSNVFSRCNNLVSLVIPDSVIQIDDCAFLDCASLTMLNLPSSLKYLGEYALAGTNLEYEVVDEVRYLDNWAIGTVDSFITPVPSGPIKAPALGISFTQYLSNLEAEGYISITTVPYEDWDANTKPVKQLKPYSTKGSTLTIREGTLGIADKAFLQCNVLKSDDSKFVGYDDTFITYANFYSNHGYSATQIEQIFNLSYDYQYDCFLSDAKTVKQISLPDSLKYIGVRAFRNANYLEKIEIPAGVEEIATGAFQGCESLSSVTLNEGLKYIGDKAFSHCSSLKGIVIPASVTKIDYYAFKACKNLVVAFKNLDNLEYVNQAAFEGVNAVQFMYTSHGVTYFNDTAISYSRSADDNDTIEIDEDTLVIDNNFAHDYSIQGIILPEGLQNIKLNAFAYITSMSINVPSGVKLENRSFIDFTTIELYIDDATLAGAANDYSGIFGVDRNYYPYMCFPVTQNVYVKNGLTVGSFINRYYKLSPNEIQQVAGYTLYVRDYYNTDSTPIVADAKPTEITMTDTLGTLFSFTTNKTGSYVFEALCEDPYSLCSFSIEAFYYNNVGYLVHINNKNTNIINNNLCLRIDILETMLPAEGELTVYIEFVPCFYLNDEFDYGYAEEIEFNFSLLTIATDNMELVVDNLQSGLLYGGKENYMFGNGADTAEEFVVSYIVSFDDANAHNVCFYIFEPTRHVFNIYHNDTIIKSKTATKLGDVMVMLTVVDGDIIKLKSAEIFNYTKFEYSIIMVERELVTENIGATNEVIDNMSSRTFDYDLVLDEDGMYSGSFNLTAAMATHNIVCVISDSNGNEVYNETIFCTNTSVVLPIEYLTAGTYDVTISVPAITEGFGETNPISFDLALNLVLPKDVVFPVLQ